MRLFLQAARLALGAVVVAWATPGCYTAGGGSAPPLTSFYFPTGLVVSSGGNVLYAINSDFDLQWSGGTLQSYDLFKVRKDTAALIQANLSGSTPPEDIPFIDPWQPGCTGTPPGPASNGRGVYLGQACSPPVDSSQYVRNTVIVGAFATDLQLAAQGQTRLFAPVGGNATVTWADVGADDPNTAPAESATDATDFAPFKIDCGALSDQRCDSDHQTGNNPYSPFNTRNATMPGEPFGLAQSEDGTVVAVTSEVDTKTSLLTTGLGAGAFSPTPTMQFVLDGLPTGGVGIAAVPHDPIAVVRCEDVGNTAGCVHQAFLQTSRAANEIDLLRYFDDDGSSIRRPFLNKEATYAVTANSNGSDSRGIAIDTSERIACEAAATPDQLLACAQTPANVFIANRTPSTIVTAKLGQILQDGSYDPDRLLIDGNVSLTDGPSKIYLAPIVNGLGNYEMRIFVVCYDTNSIFVFDPKAVAAHVDRPEKIISTGQGPYALAFDPFSLEDVALGKPVPADPRQDPALGLKRYRFMYIASFRESYVQVIDLDESNPETFQNVVFTLGQPTPPKGT